MLIGGHNSDNLVKNIKKIIHKFGIENKVNHIVSDNASNVTSAIKKMNFKQFRCFGHILNLIVSSTFQSVRKPFNSVDKNELVDYNLEIPEDSVGNQDTSIVYADTHETTMLEIVDEYNVLINTNSTSFKTFDAGEYSNFFNYI